MSGTSYSGAGCPHSLFTRFPEKYALFRPYAFLIYGRKIQCIACRKKRGQPSGYPLFTMLSVNPILLFSFSEPLQLQVRQQLTGVPRLQLQPVQSCRLFSVLHLLSCLS